MDFNLFIICFLTFIIHLIGTLAYSVRIAGIRTRKIAISFSMFNILILLSRTSNTFQLPFLAGRIEDNLKSNNGMPMGSSMLSDFHWLLFSASLATIVGAFMIPSCQRFFSKAIFHFQKNRSIPKLILFCFTKKYSDVKEICCMPTMNNITQLNSPHGVTKKILIMNVLAVSLWTVGVFASMYAGYLNPEVRVTSSTLSSIINGFATIIMFIFIDPHLSMMTDDVVEGKMTDSQFRRSIVWLVGSRLGGTLLAHLLIVPAATTIVFVAEIIIKFKY